MSARRPVGGPGSNQHQTKPRTGPPEPTDTADAASAVVADDPLDQDSRYQVIAALMGLTDACDGDNDRAAEWAELLDTCGNLDDGAADLVRRWHAADLDADDWADWVDQHPDGLSPRDVADMKDVGLDAADASVWMSDPGNPHSFDGPAKHRIPPSDVADWAEKFETHYVEEAQGYFAANLSADEAQEFWTMDVLPPEASNWTDHGFDVADTAEWRDYGFNAVDAAAWSNAEFDPDIAAEWSMEGFDADIAKKWQEHFYDAGLAAEWRDAGFELDAAVSAADDGLTPEEANENR